MVFPHFEIAFQMGQHRFNNGRCWGNIVSILADIVLYQDSVAVKHYPDLLHLKQYQPNNLLTYLKHTIYQGHFQINVTLYPNQQHCEQQKLPLLLKILKEDGTC